MLPEQQKIIKKIKLLIPLNQETLTSYLSPMLGQWNIKNNDFLKKFVIEFNKFTEYIYDENFTDFLNDKSKILADLDLIIPVILLIFENKKYELFFKAPTIGFLFKIVLLELAESQLNYIKYFYIYKITLLKSMLIYSGLNKVKIRGMYFQIRHSLKKKVKKFLL